MNCSGFCTKQVNNKGGLKAIIKDGKDMPFRPGLQNCPIGYKHNPEKLEQVENIVKAGGRLTICPNNPWKWMKV